jgi:hypothetical protein
MKPLRLISGKITMLALLAVILPVSQNYAQDPDPNFYIFLAFGQSNMEGWASNGVNQIEQQDREVPDRFQTLPAVDWPDGSKKKGTWTKALPPQCRSSTGLNPCDYFGRTLVDSLPENIRVGIITVAVAGCKIEIFDKAKYQSYISGEAQWMKNIANEYGGNPYGRLVEMAKLAQKDGVIKGFLLHQGESNGGDSPQKWGNSVKKVYNDLITDLDLDASATPLLAGDLVSSSGMVKGLPNYLDNSYVISSQGLQARSDNLHFAGPGYREFGKRYGRKMFEILKDQITAVPEDSRKTALPQSDRVRLRTAGKNAVSFTLPENASVTVNLYTLGGKEITRLAAGKLCAGDHTLPLPEIVRNAGICLVKLTAGARSVTRTMYTHL